MHPLFVRDETGSRYVTAKSRWKYFAPDSFPAEKAPGTFRVFCIGGSTVQGRPYSIETSFPTWMKLGLAEADPGRTWEVVNCGGISYATYRLVPILEECLQYQPDLIVLCEGHNEFLEDRTYEGLKHSSAPARLLHEAVAGSRIATLLRRALAGGSASSDSSASRSILPDDADALLNYRRGLRAYHRDVDWRAGVIAHFEVNLKRMVAMCAERDVPVIVMLPPSNLADCPPFKSQHRDGMTGDDLAVWNRLNDESHEACRSKVRQAVRLLARMLEIDSQFAATHYQLGKCYESLGRYDEARAAFIRARDLDICPLRMVSELEAAMRRVVTEYETPFLDAHRLLEARSRTGILGGPILCDRVHPSFDGHQWIADELIRKMNALGFLELRAGWQEHAAEAYRRHFESLDAHYFLKGQRTMESVERWTRGDTDGPPIELRAPHRILPGD